MTKSFLNGLAIILVLAAAVVAGNNWLVGIDDAWDWINPLMSLLGGVVIGILAVRGNNDTQDKIILYTISICLIASLLNLGLLHYRPLWHVIDALIPISFVWFACRQFAGRSHAD